MCMGTCSIIAGGNADIERKCNWTFGAGAENAHTQLYLLCTLSDLIEYPLETHNSYCKESKLNTINIFAFITASAITHRKGIGCLHFRKQNTI